MTPAEIWELCKSVSLNAPSGIDGARLLWALAGNESSFGRNAVPRHEAGYCRGGAYFDKAMTAKWGCWAHCSYGPWQILYVNAARHGDILSPVDLVSPQVSLEVTVRFLNAEILGKQGARTLDEIGDAYNSGNFRDRNIPILYVQRLRAIYEIEPSFGV